jgi:hypothetical protein
MGTAPLPGCAVQHRADRRFEALVSVGGDQLDAVQATSDQAAEEAGPARAVLGGADVQPEDLPMALGVDRGGDQDRGRADPPALTHPHAQRVDPQQRVGAGVQRPVAPGVDQLIQLGADPRDLRLGDLLDAHRPGDLIDPPGRHALHVAGHDHTGQRPLGPPAWLQDRGEEAAGAQLGNRQLDRADPGVPVARPIAVALGHPPLGRPLAALGADLGGDLDFHQRLGKGADPFAQEVHVGAVGLAQQLIQLHLGHDHRAPPRAC